MFDKTPATEKFPNLHPHGALNRANTVGYHRELYQSYLCNSAILLWMPMLNSLVFSELPAIAAIVWKGRTIPMISVFFNTLKWPTKHRTIMRSFIRIMQKSWEITETLAYGYLCERSQWELSNEYQHDRVSMVFKNICVFVLCTKLASALEGLKSIEISN